MPEIRPYRHDDYDAVRKICLECSDVRKRTEVQRLAILKTYCDYYIEVEPQNCFVAVDENDKPIGYILCAENYGKYNKVFSEKYLPVIKAFGFTYMVAARSSSTLHGRYAGYYPSHMHIDILPEYQRQGLGTKLVDALAEHLRSRDGRGVMLIVGKKNEKGMNFYSKYGFSVINTISGAVIMGLELY